MNKQDAIATIDKSLESLNNALRDGRTDILVRYLTASASFHRNSFRNVTMIYSQSPEATFVAGYNAWKKRSRWVYPLVSILPTDQSSGVTVWHRRPQDSLASPP